MSRALCLDLHGDFGCMLSTFRSGGLGCKTYALQQDGGDSVVRGGEKATYSRGAQTRRESCRATHTCAAPRRSRTVCVDCEETLVAFHALFVVYGLGHKGARLTFCSKDDRGSDVRGGEEAMHASVAHSWHESLERSHAQQR